MERALRARFPLSAGEGQTNKHKSASPKRAAERAFHLGFVGMALHPRPVSEDATSDRKNAERHVYGRRPNHATPWWVPTDAIFHIRIRIAPNSQLLTEPLIARALLESVRFYAERRRWHFAIFLLMPDHCHALLTFPSERRMSRVIGDWKHWHAARTGVQWQENFFDHRLRDDAGWEEKFRYIRNNPVVKGLCHGPGDWPWQLIGTDDESRPLNVEGLDGGAGAPRTLR